jgi:hypothetical protein
MKKAYQQYRKDGGNMHIDTFREKIHEFRYKNGECIGLAEIGKKYYHLIHSDDKTISGIDPSGGPYIKVHQELDWLGEEFKDLCVSTITSTETGYRIGTYGKYDHLADLETIGGIINRTKKLNNVIKRIIFLRELYISVSIDWINIIIRFNDVMEFRFCGYISIPTLRLIYLYHF